MVLSACESIVSWWPTHYHVSLIIVVIIVIVVIVIIAAVIDYRYGVSFNARNG